jgi:very-short-patch-repair endonuclease
MTKSEVGWRVRSGVWVPVVGAGLRRATEAADEVTEAHAALLTWPDSVVALTTAARLHGIPVQKDGRVHVVVPHGRPARGILVPHQYPLDPGDVTNAYGVPTTTVRRTVVDLLGRLPPSAQLDLVAWVSSRRLLDDVWLSTWLRQHPWRWGNVARAAAATRLAAGAVNPAEDLLHALLRRGHVGGWQGGASLLEHIGVPAQADVYFPAVRLVIEVDGRRAHGPDRFQADRTRQNRLVAAGCTVLRYTWQDLVERPDEVLAQIRATVVRLASRLP